MRGAAGRAGGLVAALWMVGAAADPARGEVRVGDHPGFGRVVIDLKPGMRPEVAVAGERVLLVLPGAGALGTVAPPRNVARLEGGLDAATLVLAPGARVRTVRLGDRLVIDALDPAPGLAREPAAPGAVRGAPSARWQGQPGRRQAAMAGAPGRMASAGVGAAMLRDVLAEAALAGGTGEQPGGLGGAGPEAPGQALAEWAGTGGARMAVGQSLAKPDGAPAARAPTQAAAAPARAAAYDRTAAAPRGEAVLAPATAPEPMELMLGAKALDAGPARGKLAAEAPKQPNATAPIERAPPDRLGVGKAGEPPLPGITTAPVLPVLREAPVEPERTTGGRASKEAFGPEVARLLLPTDADVGAAAFRRGGAGLVVLDRRLPALEVSEWPDARVMLGAVSTVVSVPLGEGQALAVGRELGGWRVRMVADDGTEGGPPNGPMAGSLAGAAFGVARPGRSVAVADPVGMGALLVGTVLGGAEAVQGERRTPDVAVFPSWLGVALEPLSDRVVLRRTEQGFALQGAGLEGAPVAGAAPGVFGFADEPAAALQNRLQAQMAGAAAAPPRARPRERVGVARTMLGLGLGLEAQGVLQLALAEDPQLAGDAFVRGLAAMAAVLAGRPAEAEALDDPALRRDGLDGGEPALWQGLRDRRLGRETAASAGVGAHAGRVLGYPAGLRRAIWSEVAEAAVESGVEPGGALAMETLPPFARALQQERVGDIEAALTSYERLAAGPDRLDQVRARVRRTELLLAAGRISPGAAAEAIEQQATGWRGDAREGALRLRAAALRAASGAYREALAAMRALEAEGLAAGREAAVRREKARVFETMLAAEGGGASALDVVLLVAEYADCLPEGAAGQAMAGLLVDKLIALDLPARAIPVLQGLVRGAPAGAARAELGLRLAQALLDGGEGEAAEAALEASGSGDAPAATRVARGLLEAKLAERRGDGPGALRALDEVGTPAALVEQAGVLERSGAVLPAVEALNQAVAALAPASGPLPLDVQDLVVRQATLAARVGLRSPAPVLAWLPRLDPARADMVRLLLAAPVQAAADLPRAARELQVARAATTR